jgi:hypothetical protein
MITVTIFRSALDDTRETQRLETETTIKNLFPDVDFTGAIISVNGFRQDEHYLLLDGDVCTIRLFPEGNGPDWIAGAGIGLMIGLTVLSLGTFSIVAGAIILGSGIAAGAIGFGAASAAGWSLTGWMMGGTGGDLKSPAALDKIPQLQGAKNQSNYGKPVPLVLGRHLFTPMYIGNPYTTIDGEDGENQYFHALYLLGYSRLKVTDIRLGAMNSLASNRIGDNAAKMEGMLDFNGYQEYASANPQLELRQGASEVSLYPQAVVEERLSIELSYPEGEGVTPLRVIRFTAKNPMKVQIEFTLNSGLIGYNDKGEKRDASVSVSLAWRRATPNNTDPWKPFGKIGAKQKDIAYSEQVKESAGESISESVSTITRQKTKTMRFVAERPFDYSEVKDASDRTIELRIQRTNQVNDPKTIDKIYLTAIRTWLFDNEATAANPANNMVAQVPMIAKLRNKTARLGFKIKATESMQGTIDSLNCIVESCCRTWDGTKWSDPDWDTDSQTWKRNAEIPGNNPAALALKLLQSPGLGRKVYPDKMLDLDSFGEFYEWCKDREYTCNGVLTTEKRLDDALAVILSTGRAMRILNGDRYGLLIDKPREYPVMILNSQNVLEASNQKNFEDLPDGYCIKFVNEADGYQETEVYVMAGGSNTPKADSVIENIEIPFVTNYDQVVKIGWYLLACRHLRPEVWNRKLSIDGYLIAIGDRVEVQDDTIVVGIGEGATIKKLIFENNAITEIQTDGVFDVVDTTKQYGIKIMQFDGEHPGKVRTIAVDNITEPGIYSNFHVSIPLNTNSPIPDEGDIVAFGIFDRITTPALCMGKKDNGDGTFDVVLVPYQDGIYTSDSGIIPPYLANITSPQGLKPLDSIPPDPASRNEILEIVGDLDTIFLDLEFQNYLVFSQPDGQPKEGQLPFTIQANLFRGINSVNDEVTWYLTNAPEGISIDQNGLITVLLEYQRNVNKEIARYPAADGGLADPLPEPFYPMEFIWETVTTELDVNNRIVVNAQYNGNTYTRILRVTKVMDGEQGEEGEQGDPSPRYLGKTYKKGGNTGIVEIHDNASSTRSVQAHKGDYVAYIGSSTTGVWVKGLCIRWNGESWEQIPVAADGDFESNPYMQALFDLTEGAPMGTFMSLLVQDLIAKTAMIEKLFAQFIKVNGAIYGGGYDENGNPTGGAGFHLGSNGRLKAVDVDISGAVSATAGNFSKVSAQDMSIKGGSIEIGPLFVSKTSVGGTSTVIHQAGMTTSAFINTYIPEAVKEGQAITRTVVAYYGGWYGTSTLYSFTVTKDYRSKMGQHNSYNYVLFSNVTFYTSSGTITKAASSTDKIERVEITGGGAGGIFQLTGVPSDPTGLSKGMLYRDPMDNSLKIVS